VVLIDIAAAALISLIISAARHGRTFLAVHVLALGGLGAKQNFVQSLQTFYPFESLLRMERDRFGNLM
jgi:hypothetical protein